MKLIRLVSRWDEIISYVIQMNYTARQAFVVSNQVLNNLPKLEEWLSKEMLHKFNNMSWKSSMKPQTTQTKMLSVFILRQL